MTVLQQDLSINGGGTLSVGGVVIVDADGNIDAPVTSTNIHANGTLSSTGNFYVNTDKFTVAASTGNTLLAGTLTVTGATTFNGNVTLGAGDDLIGSATSDILINTDKFTVAGATGNTVVAGTLGVTGKITGDDVDLTSGAVIAGLGTGATGIVLKNLKNAAASSLSGTQLDVEIDIGGVPYHFTVYPTKA